MNQKSERRRFPRIKDKGISVQLAREGYSTVTQSLNISANGIYCKVAERLPLMSRLKIVLTIPDEKGEGGFTVLNMEGVVVREHSVMKDGRAESYDVAVFFDSLTPKDREKLAKYIEKKSKSAE